MFNPEYREYRRENHNRDGVQRGLKDEVSQRHDAFFFFFGCRQRMVPRHGTVYYGAGLPIWRLLPHPALLSDTSAIIHFLRFALFPGGNYAVSTVFLNGFWPDDGELET